MLIPRLGLTQRKLLPLVGQLGARLASISLNLPYQPPLPLEGVEPPALVLDPETTQLELAEEDRGRPFLKLRYGDLPRVDPDADRADDKTLVEYAQLVLTEQFERGASVLITPYHHARANGPGRTSELLLARAAVAVFEREGMAEAAWSGTTKRQLLAGLMLGVSQLRDEKDVEFLLRSYAAINVDGFWVRLHGFHEGSSETDVRNGTRFLRLLQQRSERPVVACCPGDLALPLLCGGLAGASIGIVEGERVQPPAPMRRNRSENGRRRRVYHPDFSRSFWSHETEAIEAFKSSGCDCGEHEPHVRPQAFALDRHTCRSRLIQAARFTTGPTAERAARFRASLAKATWAANDARLSQPPAATLLAALEEMLVKPVPARPDQRVG